MNLHRKLRRMGRLAVSSFDDPLSLIAARRAVRTLGRSPRAVEPIAICAFLKQFRYVRERPETLVDLRGLFQLGAGDCDDFAVAAAAMLWRLDWFCVWCVGWRNGRPAHIWTVTQDTDGRVLHVDPTHDLAPCGANVLPWDRVTFHEVTL